MLSLFLLLALAAELLYLLLFLLDFLCVVHPYRCLLGRLGQVTEEFYLEAFQRTVLASLSLIRVGRSERGDLHSCGLVRERRVHGHLTVVLVCSVICCGIVWNTPYTAGAVFRNVRDNRDEGLVCMAAGPL